MSSPRHQASVRRAAAELPAERTATRAASADDRRGATPLYSRASAGNTENIPIFLVVGFLFIVAPPPLWAAQVVLYGYVVTRVLHFLA